MDNQTEQQIEDIEEAARVYQLVRFFKTPKPDAIVIRQGGRGLC